jgi:hypothetical protein
MIFPPHVKFIKCSTVTSNGAQTGDVETSSFSVGTPSFVSCKTNMFAGEPEVTMTSSACTLGFGLAQGVGLMEPQAGYTFWRANVPPCEVEAKVSLCVIKLVVGASSSAGSMFKNTPGATPETVTTKQSGAGSGNSGFVYEANGGCPEVELLGFDGILRGEGILKAEGLLGEAADLKVKTT